MKRLQRLGEGMSQGSLGGKPRWAADVHRASRGPIFRWLQLGQVGKNLVGVKWDVADEVSGNEEDLLGLVTFQSKESIQNVCDGAELNDGQRNEVMEVLKKV